MAMSTEAQTRRVECPACGADVSFALQHGYDVPDVRCSKCGAKISDHAAALEVARARLSIEEAVPIAMKHTYEQMMDMARKIYDDPSSATPEELDALASFRLLRGYGLPCHAPEKPS